MRLDEAGLEVLAGKLQALLASPVRVLGTPEIAARQRVFAGVLRATAENLEILRRVACGPGEGSAWAL